MSGDLTTRDLASFWHPCAQMRDYRDFAPLEVVRARGAQLELADGRILLDAISSWWCKTLGHGHPHLRRALEQQLNRFEHVIVANVTHEPLVRLCERVLAMANGEPPESWGERASPGRRAGHLGKVFLADNGSTAVEIALKMALQAQAQRGTPQRTRFASFANGYHGETTGALSVGDLGLYGEPYRPLMFPVTKLGPLPYRAGPADPRWYDADDAWPAIEAQLERCAPDLAAVVYEPVLQAAGGMLLYSPALLTRLAAWARDRGVFLIADEIAAGMGRLGTMLASQLAEHAQADFVVLSKGLTGGFLPLSAVLTTDAVYALFEGSWADRKAFLHSNTYTGNALAVAVANAALDVYAGEELRTGLPVRADQLASGLRDVVSSRPFLRGARAAGLMVAVDLVGPGGERLDPAHRTGYRVYQEAVRRGALLRPLGDTMYLFPPLVTPASELQRMLEILADSVDAVLT